MKTNLKPILIAALACLVLSCLTHTELKQAKILAVETDYNLVEADSPRILYHGRIDRRNPKEPVFDWAASGFSIRFQGSSVGVVLTDSGKNTFSIFIDGQISRRIAAEEGEQRILLAENLTPGVHTLDFYKSTESDEGRTSVKGILLEPGAELLEPEKKDFIIQVFGDSISAGFGTAAPRQDGEWHREHADACRTWAFFAARALDAELILTAASGRGIIRNAGEPGPKSVIPFPSLAWRVLLNDENHLVPDSEPAPDIVIVCLGANDMSYGYKLGREEIRKGYLNFLGEIRRRWPDVPVLFGSQQMDSLPQWLKEIVDDQTLAGDENLYWYAFSHTKKGEFGCDNHPGEIAQKRFAEEIIPLISSVTGRLPVR